MGASPAELVDECYALELSGDVVAAMERVQQALEIAEACDDASAKAFLYFRQGRYTVERGRPAWLCGDLATAEAN